MKLRLLLFIFLVSPFLHAERTGWPLPPAESFLAIVPLGTGSGGEGVVVSVVVS